MSLLLSARAQSSRYLVLADEINRATPKTQSALLEAMQEHAVTIRHFYPPKTGSSRSW